MSLRSLPYNQLYLLYTLIRCLPKAVLNSCRSISITKKPQIAERGEDICAKGYEALLPMTQDPKS